VYSNETGAFLFSGFVPGSAGSVSAASGAGMRERGREDVQEFKVSGPEPIVLKDSVVPQEASRPVIGRVVLPANNPLPLIGHTVRARSSRVPQRFAPRGLSAPRAIQVVSSMVRIGSG